ncbi:MAG: hypothetical protein NVS1B14_01730 [Vulcanimicrobiaceae bacterium]
MNRTALTLACAGVVGTLFLRRYPFPEHDALLGFVLGGAPAVFHALRGIWYVMLFSTPALAFSMLFSLVFIFAGRETRKARGTLPPFPVAGESVQVVVGERHHPTRPEPVENPEWLVIPDRGLFAGIAVFGAVGSGKTSGAVLPFAKQILSFRPGDPARRIGGMVLEVKGDLCHQIRALLEGAGRAGDYVEIGLDGEWVYNPLHNDLDAFALAYSIATLLNNLYGHGHEPFWQQAYTNLVKFIIVLYKVVDRYVTLFDVYECAIDPSRLEAKIRQGEQMFATIAAELDAPDAWISIEPLTYIRHDALAAAKWDTVGDRMRTPYSDEMTAALDAAGALYTIEMKGAGPDPEDLARRMNQFAAVKRWARQDWGRIDRKLQTSIVEGISVHLSMVDDNLKLKRGFCPLKEAYDAKLNAEGRFGKPVLSFNELIEAGQVVALNFPIAANPASARCVGTMLKQDFQRAMLNRIPVMAAHPERRFREALFLCDEYQAFATVGESDPSGDEKFFALSRQAKCIPIVATQSVSSLRSTLPGESWRTLVQTFRTKLFLATADDQTARWASDLCGREEQMIQTTSISESGQDVRVSMLTGRAVAEKAGVTLNESYAPQMRPVFESKVFMELKNAQCVALAYDGVNAVSPALVMLKPFYLDAGLSYFEQAAGGLL